jgi:hypothetical protein
MTAMPVDSVCNWTGFCLEFLEGWRRSVAASPGT